MLPEKTREYQAQWRRAKYRERREKHICVTCGKRPAEKGKTMCKMCSDNLKQSRAESKKFYTSLGICYMCHKNRIYGDETVCPECAAKRSSRNEKTRQKPTAEQIKHRHAYGKNYYAECKKKKICPTCGSKVTDGYVRCPKCREKGRMSQTRRRMTDVAT